MMKGLLLGGAFAAILAYAWFGRADANVYSMPVAEAYSKLTAAKVQNDGKTALGRLVYTVSGNGENKVYWNGSGGTFATTHCEAEITPEGASKSRIMAFCNGGSLSDGAAAGMVSGMQRKAMIEHIDATLTGRPFDIQNARGETASRWPSDAQQPDGSYGTAVAGALNMERDIRKMERDIDKMEKEQDEKRAAHQGVTFQAGKPMVDLSQTSR